MQCIFGDAKNTYELFKFISQFETNIKLECSPSGITMFTMSNCHSVFIDVNLPADYFETFECEDPVSVGLNLTVLLSALSGSKPKDSLIMQCSNGDTVTFTKMSGDKEMEYVIKQMNIEDENIAVPDLEENVTVKVHTSYLKEWKKNIVDFTKSTLVLQPTPKMLKLSSVGDGGTVNVKQPVPSIGISYETCNEPRSVTLGNKNVTKIFSIGDVSSDVEMGYQNGMPFRCSAKLSDIGTLRVFMAPCIGESMDDE
jgi:proliferating cell nuclear antigen PCNA